MARTRIGVRGRIGTRVVVEIVLPAHPFAQVPDREYVDVVVHPRVGRQRAHFVVEHRTQLIRTDRALFGGFLE